MILIKGHRSVFEAVQSETRIEKVVIQSNKKQSASIQPIIALCQSENILVTFLSPAYFKAQYPEDQTQGIVAICASFQHQSLSHILAKQDQYPLIVLLDHIQDPYNFGSIIRTSETLGARAVIYPQNRNAQLTPGTIKAASGALYHLDLIKVINLATTIDQLKAAGYWIYGADSNQGQLLSDCTPHRPTALVVGNESKGISSLIQKKIDVMVKIPMAGQLTSMNVSVATGIILYEFGQHLMP